MIGDPETVKIMTDDGYVIKDRRYYTMYQLGYIDDEGVVRVDPYFRPRNEGKEVVAQIVQQREVHPSRQYVVVGPIYGTSFSDPAMIADIPTSIGP
jgi:uncharacterized protein YjiK